VEAAISESQKRKATASGEEKATGGRRRAGRGSSEAAAGDTWRVAGHSPFAAAVASSRTKRCRCHRAVDQIHMGPENPGCRPIDSESQPEVSIRPIKYLYWARLAVAVEASSVEALLQGLGPFQAAADRQLSARLPRRAPAGGQWPAAGRSAAGAAPPQPGASSRSLPLRPAAAAPRLEVGASVRHRATVPPRRLEHRAPNSEQRKRSSRAGLNTLSL
jgi:hypothetical protein